MGDGRVADLCSGYTAVVRGANIAVSLFLEGSGLVGIGIA